uniref:MAM domain-containing protein n=1 Tax=Strigamia maritima TaxID=126957 RepID=T1JBC8_STRMM
MALKQAASLCTFAVIIAQFTVSSKQSQFLAIQRQAQSNSEKPLTNSCTFDAFDAISQSASNPQEPSQTSSAAPSEDATVTTVVSRLKPHKFKGRTKRASISTICNLWDITNSSWTLSSASNAYFNGGPLEDASKNKTAHGYLVLDLYSKKTLSITSRRVTSSTRPPTGPKGVCFKFAHVITGLGAGGLEVVLSTNASDESGNTNASEKIIWKNFDVSQGKWKRGSVSFTSSKPYKISFQGVDPDFNLNIADFRGYVAIDETQLFEGFCRGDCNFDLNTCQWENDALDDFDWTLGWGTHFSNTGPLKDHSDYGGYLYVDSNYPRRTGDIARIISPILTATDPFCLRFWVSEFGTGLGPLSVFIAPSPGNSTLIWSIKEPLGAGLARDIWYPAQVTVSWPTTFRVIIQAAVGISSRGNIAIDDISFQTGTCAPLPTIANGRPGECAFVDDRCKWTVQRVQQAMNSPDMWKLVNSGTQVAQPKGHTLLPDSLNDGYMKFETNSFTHQPLDRSRILSPILPPTDGKICMNFWVYLSSPITSKKGLGALQVLLLNSTNESTPPTVIWRLENHQFPHWIQCQVSISSEIPFQVAFEGIRGAQVLGLIAVDDIAFVYPAKVLKKKKRFRRQDAPAAPEVSTAASGETPTEAPEGATVSTPVSEAGDATTMVTQIISNDAKDSCIVLPIKAKVFPADCSFDVDFCGWTTSGISSDIKWQMAKPNKSPTNVHDRTYNIPQAGFIYFDPFTPAGNPTTAHIESITLTPASSVMCMTFWFMIYGNDITASLSVSERKLKTEPWREVWKENMVTRAPKWRFAELSIGVNQTEPFKVILSSTSRAATVVVDDVKFYDDRCRKKP